jgi:hypothetical protein
MMKAIATQLTGKYVTNDLRRRISPTAKNEFMVPGIMQPVFDDIIRLTTAFEKGLIPFIPTNTRKAKPEQRDCATILKFPTGEVKVAQCKLSRKSEDERPTLFDGLEQL